MKKLAFLLLFLSASFVAFAQTQVATLQHGDNVSVFYGSNAFVESYNAAETGDVITLSSGAFTSPYRLNKAITLRGAGALQDTALGSLPTIISGSLTFEINNNTSFLTIEGIYFSGLTYINALVRPCFIKCMFNSLNDLYSTLLTNAQFVNCMFETFGLQYDNNESVQLINCVAHFPYSYASTIIEAYNSIIIGGAKFDNLSAYNCIIGQLNESNYGGLQNNSIAYNCIGIKIPESYNGPFHNATTFNCMTVENYSDVFETFDGTFSFNEQYILKDEIAMSFLGNDGTQVGIHGGLFPYTIRPSYMVMKRVNVANQSTIDGNLNVEIELVDEDE